MTNETIFPAVTGLYTPNGSMYALEIVMNLKRTIRTIALSVLLAVTMSSASLACPTCKDSIPNTDSSQAVAVPSGFNRSVYTLLGGFLLVLGAVSGMIVKVIREPNATRRCDVIDQQPKK